MYLMYYLDDAGERVYTLQVSAPCCCRGCCCSNAILVWARQPVMLMFLYR